jgi:glucose 1-dehydrogenase
MSEMTSLDSFEGRGAIVTGAGVGIGYEIARQLARRGARVVLNDIDSDVAHAAAERLTDEGDVIAVAGDSSDLAVIDRMVASAVNAGSLDMVVANAGITTFGDFLTYAPEQFEQVTGVNLRGTFFLAQRAALAMIDAGGGGSMVFTSSVTGHQAHPKLAAYGMTKAAIRMLAKSLGVELAPYGVRVNAVSPGATLTERTMEDAGYRAEWSELVPLGEPATPSDIAEAVLFLLSGAARHITAQTLVVDGGWTAYSPPPEV